MTIGTRVDDEFGAAVAYFAKMDGMSIADYARASLQRKAVRMIQDRTASYDEKRRVAGLMDDALKNGTWKQVLADSPDTFPSTKDEWKKQIEKYEKAADFLGEEISEMKSQIRRMKFMVF